MIEICLVDNEQLKKKIGQRIVALRSQKGWSQSDLAKACNKDRRTLEKLEKGEVNPTIYSLLEICNALGISLKELVNF
ncbi:helix-turn-helix transcriptional regulator [Tenacibaculum sp. FZY0031]|uniref:helix-turn-helix domain-containing protein n=1 Tax=Tenacibaculum sp. FZY0031 TaxID=3116648 RepID=UPI002EBE2D88|nr:helix-turn-helix transcriptional regulator [Tenacibaculum sp. FZY0031]